MRNGLVVMLLVWVAVVGVAAQQSVTVKVVSDTVTQDVKPVDNVTVVNMKQEEKPLAAEVRQTVNGHSVTLSGNQSTSVGVTGYYFYRGATSGGESTTPLNATPTPTVSYVDTTVVGLTTYWYTAKANCPTCTPALSVAETPDIQVVVPGDPQPLPPTGLTAVSQ